MRIPIKSEIKQKYKNSDIKIELWTHLLYETVREYRKADKKTRMPWKACFLELRKKYYKIIVKPEFRKKIY